MRLSHFTSEPITELVDVQQSRTHNFKPCGLWVSADGEDDWPSWCRDNNFGDCGKQLRYRVELKKHHNVLLIVHPLALRDFHKDYSKESPYGHGREIDWPRVAERWGGIIIAPYQWSARMDFDMFWYYGWDCASGCIWSANEIESIYLTEEEEVV